MKKSTLFVVLFVTGIVGVVAFGIISTPESDESIRQSLINNQNINALSINDIQSDPFAFTGKITINGVAASFSEKDNTLFGMMDTAELLACQDLSCGAYMLPAQYTGSKPLPTLADVVDVTGSFVKTDTGYYFSVADFTVKRNIMRLISR